ncbi:MAG: hypothetical protein H6714_00705 [Myxococcales bacterium]|nr:hypothetical protein [Myxococcales bacterium]
MRANGRIVQCLALGLCIINTDCHVDGASTGQHTNRQQEAGALLGSLARTQHSVLESFNDRRGTWQPDGQITAGEWVTLLGDADADGFVLVKPRAELDIIRRMHLSQLQVEEKLYDIPLMDSASLDVRCPIHSLDDTASVTHTGPFALMPVDLASSYRWVTEQGKPIGFVSRYCSYDERYRALPSLQELGEMAQGGSLVLNQAWSCDAPVCYGFELESTSLGIVDYYRTKDISEADWQSMPRNQKEAALEAAFTSGALGIGKRLSSAPVFLSEILRKERDTIWEVTATPQPSSQQMLAQMAIVRDLFEARWSVHLHGSFPVASPPTQDTNQLRHLAYLINEYLALRVYAHDVPAVLHPFTGPSTWERTANIGLALANAHQTAGALPEFKFYFVALRCRDPYGEGRCGFEIRRSVAGLPEQLWLLERLKDFWSDPSAGLRLHNQVPLAIESTTPEPNQMLSSELWTTFQPSRPTLAFGLEFAAPPPQYNGTPLYEIAMLPMIDWEARIAQWQTQGRITPDQAADLKGRVAAARTTYLNSLSAGILSGNGKMESARIPPVIALSLHTWAQQTELWKYY